MNSNSTLTGTLQANTRFSVKAGTPMNWIFYHVCISVTWMRWETLPLTVSDAVEEGWTLQDKCQGEFFSIEIGQGILGRFYSDKTIAILMYQLKNEFCPPYMRKNTLDYDVRNSDFIIPRLTTITHESTV